MFGRLLARRHAAPMNDKVGETPHPADGDGGRSVDRRGMLRLGGMAAAGAAGAAAVTALNASPAAAGIDGDFVLSADNTNTTDRSAIITNLPDTEVGGFFNDASGGAAVRGRSGQDSVAFPWTSQKTSSFGLYGESRNGTAVGAFTDTGTAIEALTVGGVAVDAHSDGGVAVKGSSVGGYGVSGFSRNNIGVSAQALGINPALRAANDFGTGGALVAENTDISSVDGPHCGPAIVARLLDIGDGTPTANAVIVRNEGTGHGIEVSGHGPDGAIGKGSAINAHLDNASNASTVVNVSTAGSGKAVNAATGAGTAVAATAGTGIGLLATANTATSVNPAVKAQSNGKGAAVVAATTANATLPAVQATSGSAQPAVQAIGNGFGAGPALQVVGKATFTRSGVANIASGANNVVVAVPGGLTASSHVLATIQGSVTGNIAVKSVAPNTSTGKITIFLTANAPAALSVAWFVFG